MKIRNGFVSNSSSSSFIISKELYPNMTKELILEKLKFVLDTTAPLTGVKYDSFSLDDLGFKEEEGRFVFDGRNIPGCLFDIIESYFGCGYWW